MKGFFQFLANVINGSERGILDFLSAIVPYAVPIIPAYLTYYHTRDMMDFPSWVAFTAAFVVEVLGMTSVSTSIRFWRNNQRYKSEQNKAPFTLAIMVYIFYIVVVLAVNVILEIESGIRGGWIILSIALFTMLSFPSGVLISIRAQYSEMLEDRTTARTPKGKTKEDEPLGFSNKKYASNYRDKILAYLDQEYEKSGKVLTPKEITSHFKLEHGNNKGYVSTLTKEWKSGKPVL